MIVAIEGVDQAGKKTQAAMLGGALKKAGVRTKTFSFPDYTTPVGREIRGYLRGRRDFPPQAIHCLLAANRWERLPDIQRALEKNSVLIMNRYYHSNVVYGAVNGLKESWLENLDRGMPRADLVILLDVGRADSFSRKKSNRDRFEGDGEFLRRVAAAYRRTARRKRWHIVDASGTKRRVHDDVMRAFARKFRTVEAAGRPA